MTTEAPIILTAVCEEGHVQKLQIDGAMGMEWAQSLGGLMDGTSSFYIKSPRGDDSSLIGKCGICGSQINCKVEQE